MKYLGTILLLFFGAFAFAQNQSITLSGIVKDKKSQTALPFVNVVVKTEKDSVFVTGTVTDTEGRFSLTGLAPKAYTLEFSFMGYTTQKQTVFVGNLSDYLQLAPIELQVDTQTLQEVVVNGKGTTIASKMDKKTYALEDNLTQGGGSVLQTMQNLPGVTVQEGKVLLRGNDKVTLLIDGKQTALTGFGSQSGLDNIPASAIDRIEIINNPSSKYDANGNAGIINIVMKKNKQNGLNGKVGLTAGLGSLWVRKENLPTIRPQYTLTPKINRSFALNYRKNKVNLFEIGRASCRERV